MRPDEDSQVRGGGSFETTHWTDIFEAQTLDPDQRRQAEERIARRYWKPVYCYVRRMGLDPDKAKDLTQGFFCDVIVERKLISHARRAKGRFRTFVLSALRHYAIDVHRAERSGRRHPAGHLWSLTDMEGKSLPEPAAESTPEDAFHHAWVASLLDEVLASARDSCRAAGQEAYWEIFEARCLHPIVEGVEPVSLAELCRRYDVSDEKKASNMLMTVKRRLGRELRNRVQPWVRRGEDPRREIQDLIGIILGSGAA